MFFPLHLEHMEIKEWAPRIKEHDCVTATLFQINMPESRQNNVSSYNQLERDVHLVNVGRGITMDW